MQKLKAKKLKAIIFIQRSWRRFKERRNQLLRLQQKNKEDEEWAQKLKAARTIWQRWRAYKKNQALSAKRFFRFATQEMGKTIEVVYHKDKRPCMLCSDQFAVRICPSVRTI